MSLADPTKKMSKSDSDTGSVRILDSRDDIMRKFKRAVTDCDAKVEFAPGKDGINNLINIYSCFTGKDMKSIEAEFDSKGYGEFKLAVGEAVADGLAPIQSEFARLIADKKYLEDIMKQGADNASYRANKTLRKVYKKLGFII